MTFRIASFEEVKFSQSGAVPFFTMFKKITMTYYQIKGEDNKIIGQCRLNQFPIPNITCVLLGASKFLGSGTHVGVKLP